MSVNVVVEFLVAFDVDVVVVGGDVDVMVGLVFVYVDVIVNVVVYACVGAWFLRCLYCARCCCRSCS